MYWIAVITVLYKSVAIFYADILILLFNLTIHIILL